MRNRTRKRKKNVKKYTRLVPSITRAQMHEQRMHKASWNEQVAGIDVGKLRSQLSIAQLRARPLTPDERDAAKSLLDQKRRKIAKLEDRIEASEKKNKRAGGMSAAS